MTFIRKESIVNIEFFGKEIPLYGVFFWLGVFASALSAVFVCKKKKLPLFDLTCSGVYTMIGGIIGAKGLYILISLNDIIAFAEAENLGFWELMPAIIKGGFVFYGGLIGGAIGLIAYAKEFKKDLSLLFEIYTSVLPLGHAFGRIGCFFGGCCYGVEYDGPFSYVYEVAAGQVPLGIPLFPVQILEALCLLLLFAVQMLLLVRFSEKKHILLCNYTFSYAAIRFGIEFLRGDVERGRFLILSTSQWISVGIIVIMTVTMSYRYFKLKKGGCNFEIR